MGALQERIKKSLWQLGEKETIRKYPLYRLVDPRLVDSSMTVEGMITRHYPAVDHANDGRVILTQNIRQHLPTVSTVRQPLPMEENCEQQKFSHPVFLINDQGLKDEPTRIRSISLARNTSAVVGENVSVENVTVAQSNTSIAIPRIDELGYVANGGLMTVGEQANRVVVDTFGTVNAGNARINTAYIDGGRAFLNRAEEVNADVTTHPSHRATVYVAQDGWVETMSIVRQVDIKVDGDPRELIGTLRIDPNYAHTCTLNGKPLTAEDGWISVHSEEGFTDFKAFFGSHDPDDILRSAFDTRQEPDEEAVMRVRKALISSLPDHWSLDDLPRIADIPDDLPEQYRLQLAEEIKALRARTEESLQRDVTVVRGHHEKVSVVRFGRIHGPDSRLHSYLVKDGLIIGVDELERPNGTAHAVIRRFDGNVIKFLGNGEVTIEEEVQKDIFISSVNGGNKLNGQDVPNGSHIYRDGKFHPLTPLSGEATSVSPVPDQPVARPPRRWRSLARKAAASVFDAFRTYGEAMSPIPVYGVEEQDGDRTAAVSDGSTGSEPAPVVLHTAPFVVPTSSLGTNGTTPTLPDGGDPLAAVLSRLDTSKYANTTLPSVGRRTSTNSDTQ